MQILIVPKKAVQLLAKSYGLSDIGLLERAEQLADSEDLNY